jgi:hypothetical protein
VLTDRGRRPRESYIQSLGHVKETQKQMQTQAMPTTTPHPRRTHVESRDEHAGPAFTAPIMAPIHTWFTSPARSHPNAAQAKELPLHLIQLILSYVGALRRLAMSADAARSSTMPPTSRASRARRGCSIT